MCGITGVFHLDGNRAVDRAVLARMNQTIVHRGPDDEGFFLNGPVGLGARRLSIVDRALGHQPLASEDGKTWIAFNGEIYNHPQLRQELIGKGRIFQTNCDTETVVQAYEEYGERMVERLRGMFAFALWDGKRRRLLLYRDRIGIKPLYYSLVAGSLIFSSEVKALLAYGVEFGVEDEVLECYLRLGYVPGEKTMFRGIRKLKPGHYLVVEPPDYDLCSHRYWSPHFEPLEGRAEQQWLNEFEELLEETVGQHQLGEVPQGVFLSGGVDSSSLVSMTARQVDEPVLTFSVGYEEEGGESEFPSARRVAELYQTQHTEYRLSGGEFSQWLPKLVWHMDEPVSDPAAIPLFFIAQRARESITVVHSGEGADEILAGYSIYGRMRLITAMQRTLGRFGADALAWGAGLGFVPHRIRRYAGILNKPLAERYQGVRVVMTEDLLRRVSRNGFPTPEDSRYRTGGAEQLFDRGRPYSELNQMLFLDQQTWLPDDLLVKADKMTMAASIELRVPFLDHRVIEFAGKLPESLKLRDGKTKYLLKNLMSPHLPADILQARKRGFPVPIARWLRNEMYDSARGWILDSAFLQTYFKRDELERLIQLHRKGTADLSNELYALLNLAIWHEVFSSSRRDGECKE